MGIDDQYVGKGIGTALMTELIEIADNWLGLKRLELTVYVDNVAAIHLYEKFGFVPEGIHVKDAFRAGEFVDSLAMAGSISNLLVGNYRTATTAAQSVGRLS